MALKILLAEDEEALSRVYKAALEHQGYEVDQAFNGHKKQWIWLPRMPIK